MKTTYERLRDILVKNHQLVPEQVTMDAQLEALGIDSLGLADTMFIIEDEFQVSFPNELVDLPTVADLVAFIDNLIAIPSRDEDPQGVVTMPSLLAP
jgi:acyl carrier protein